ncbi:hypothetical protein [Paracoccus litorisediminis]|uniref:Phage major capsid protein n=1 Tax=Paracoccus litorisediminis TaxID=2006130 RepID=A0A844HJ11_9RHOB|nr:hypothetical protein [Paracoccus litorisediminis]MTH58998.1 hypothetical protein [Paracoccus litorisediminis]
MDQTNIRTIVRSVERAAFAAFKTGADARTIGGIYDSTPVARQLWPNDPGPLAILTKAAVTPLTTAGVPDADRTLNPIGEFLSSLEQSAGAKLLRAGTFFNLSGYETAVIPYLPDDPTAAPWVAEGAPIPVRDYSLTAATVGPVKKAALLTVHTAEAGRMPSAEIVFTALLRRDAARALDAALFSDAAATADTPAGLLNGLTPLPEILPDTAEESLNANLAALAAAVTEAGGQDVVFITTPALAAKVWIRKPDLAARVWGSPALDAGMVIALDPTAFVAGFDPYPAIEVSTSATLHLEDTTPAQIGTAGTPNVVAAPVRSMFQTDTVGVRMVFEMAFAMGAPAIAFMEDVAW